MAEKKTNVNALYGVLGLLVVVLAVAVYMLLDTRKNLNLVTDDLAEKTEFFRMEKDSLEGELRNIYFRYDTPGNKQPGAPGRNETATGKN